MTLLNLVDMVAGMVMIWLTVSLLVMQLQEWLVARLRMRPRMLEKTLRTMLGDGVTEQFYDHPLIRSISNGENHPSYIPAKQFAAVVLDLVQTAGNEGSFLYQHLLVLADVLDGKRNTRPALSRVNAVLDAIHDVRDQKSAIPAVREKLDWAQAELRKISVETPASEFAIRQVLAACEDFRQKVSVEQTGPDSASQKLKAGLAALRVTEPGLYQSLRVVLGNFDTYPNSPENVLLFARQGLQNWFDNAMERLNGRYKRRAVVLAFFIGFGLALVVNVDSVLLAKFLWGQAYARTDLSSQAQGLVNGQEDVNQLTGIGQMALLESRFSVYDMPFGWIGMPVVATATQTKCSLVASVSSEVYGLPLAGQCFPLTNAPRASDVVGWLLKLLGFTMTGLAAAQGAPFWFDLLKKIVNIRLSGLNPSEADSRVG